MITYTLTALIAFAQCGTTVTLQLGTNMNGPTCEANAKVAKFQLEEDLSIAKLVSLTCTKGYEI